jgi:hypothetical protein
MLTAYCLLMDTTKKDAPATCNEMVNDYTGTGTVDCESIILGLACVCLLVPTTLRALLTQLSTKQRQHL